jgi:fibronectin-binding autotransporter adhesin
LSGGSGGVGGAGGPGTSNTGVGQSAGGGGGGGAGAAALTVTGAVTISNSSTITGGAGGAGGAGGNVTNPTQQGGGIGGNGGDGGTGVAFTVSGATLMNAGNIAGGAGGAGGAAGNGLGGGSGGGGRTGDGVSGADLTVINSGMISGGNAINFTGGANTLTLQPGWALNGNIAVSGSVTFNQSTGVTLPNIVSGSGSVIQSGTGALNLMGANSYTGGTTIAPGSTLALTGAGSIASSSGVSIATGGFFDISNSGGGATIQSLAGTGTVTLGGNSLTLSNASGTFGGAINGTGGLAITGGIFTQTTSLNYLGATFIGVPNIPGFKGGTLVGGQANVFNAASAMTIGTGGTVDLGGFAQTVNTLNLAGGTLQNGTLTGAITSIGGTVNGIGGTASLTVNPGSTVLTGTDTFTGNTTVTGTTSRVNNRIVNNIAALSALTANAFSAASATTINTNGQVDLGGFAQTINTLNLAGGTLQNGALSGAITSTGGTIQNIGGTATLTANSGTTTLTGVNATNTFTATTVNNGATLSGGVNIAFSTSSVTTVNTGGTVDLGGLAQTINTLNLAGGTLQNGQFGGAVTSTGGTIRNVSDNAFFNLCFTSGGTTNCSRQNTGLLTLTAIAGTTTLTGTSISGGVNNSAVVNANGGAVNGAIANNAGGQFNVNGAVTSANAFTNASGATLTVNGGGNYTVSGLVSNAGTVTVENLGTLTANGINNNGTLTNNGTVNDDLNNTNVMNNNNSFNGNVASNTGTISNNSGGTWTGDVLTNASAINNNAGATWIGNANNSSGTLTNAGTWTGTITNAGTFTNDAPGTVSGGLTNTGTVNANGGAINGAIANNAGTFNVNGTVTSANTFTNASGAALAINGGGNYTASGLVSNPGTVTVANLGTLIANSGINNTGTLNTAGTINGALTNATTVNAQGTITGAVSNTAGTFTVTGNLSGNNTSTFNNAAGATLTVNAGTYSGLTSLTNSGTVSVASGSTLSITGNLAFLSGALYVVQVTPSAAGSTGISGTASLTGTVQANFAAGVPQKQYTILTSNGLGGTTFSALTTTNLPANFSATLSHSQDDVLLNLTAALGTGSTLSGNQQNIASVINGFFNGGRTLPPAFNTVVGLTGNSLTSALSQLSGEAGTGAEHAALQLMTEFLGLLTDPFVSGRGNGGGFGPAPGFAVEDQDNLPPEIARAYAGVFKAPPPKPVVAFDQRWNVWSAAFSGSNTTNGDAATGSNNVTVQTYGSAVGADYHFTPDTFAGFALAGAGTNWGLAQGLGGGRSDAFQVGVYGKSNWGPAYISGALAFANNWFDTNRIAPFGDQLTARFQGQSYGGRLEAGYRYAVAPMLGVIPYAALQAHSFHTPSYSETDVTGGGFALSYNAVNSTDTRSELGARFDDLTVLNGMPLVLRARLAWAHDWVSNPSLNAVFQTLPGGGFIVNGAPIPENSALVSAGGQLFLTPNLSVLAKFDGEFSSGSQTYAGTGSLRYTW